LGILILLKIELYFKTNIEKNIFMMQQLNLKNKKILWNNVETKGANFLIARVVLRVLPMHGNKDLKSN